MNYINDLSEFLSHCAGNTTDVLFEVYSIIEKYEYDEQILALQFFCEKNDSIDTDRSYVIRKQYFTDKQLETSFSRVNRINKVFGEIVYSSIISNDSSFDFYKKVWDLISSKKICKSKRDRVLSLFFLMENNLIPYMNVGTGLKMDSHDFQNIIESIDEKVIDKVKYIINLDFEQKTQRCSLLLDIILSIEDQKKQILLLSIILDAHRNRIKEKITNQINNL